MIIAPDRSGFYPEETTMHHINWRKEILTIPNLLSLLRILLIPVYMTIYLKGDHRVAALILVTSCLTDAVDGWIARRFHMISTLGKILDPVADKATQFTLTYCLSLDHPALQPVLVLFVIKECFQLVAGIIALRNGKILPGALMAGKVCTTVLFVSLIAMVLFPHLGHDTVAAIAITDGCFLAFSFANYILAYYGRSPKVQDIGQ